MSKIGLIKPLPYPLAQVGDVPIALGPGGTYVPSSGNWLAKLGVNTAVQYMDPAALQWRASELGPGGGGLFSTDGCNIRLINLTGTVASLAVTAAGSGAINGIGVVATGVAVSIAAAPAGGAPANATAYAIVGGAVVAPAITQAGSGFVAAPVIMIDPPPPGGIQATATATITPAGALATITMDIAGAGYLTPPQFYILPQPAVYYGSPIAGIPADIWPAPGQVHPNNLPQGSIYYPNINAASGALLAPATLSGSGTVTGLGLLQLGVGYTGTAPAVTITGAGAATGTATLAAAPAVDRSYLVSRVS